MSDIEKVEDGCEWVTNSERCGNSLSYAVLIDVERPIDGYESEVDGGLYVCDECIEHVDRKSPSVTVKEV